MQLENPPGGIRNWMIISLVSIVMGLINFLPRLLDDGKTDQRALQQHDKDIAVIKEQLGNLNWKLDEIRREVRRLK